MTRRKLWVLILSLSESFMLSGHYAVFMPFYPNVAHEKGNSASEVSRSLNLRGLARLSDLGSNILEMDLLSDVDSMAMTTT